MVTPSEITKDTTNSGGSFAFAQNGDEATLSWSRASATLVIASSTSVPDSMRGQGVGEALLSALIADAQEHGYKILPLCPFVRARGPHHPDWAEVAAAS